MAILRRIALRNVLSFENVAVELEPLTVFVGANNVGKTNFFRALEMAAALVTGQLEWRDAVPRVLFQGADEECISLRLVVEDGEGTERSFWEYELRFGRTPQGDRVYQEQLVRARPDGERVSFIRMGDGGQPELNPAILTSVPRRHSGRVPLVALCQDLPEIAPFIGAVQPVGRFQLDPVQMRDRAVVEPEAALNRLGSNLAAVLDALGDDPGELLKLEAELTHAYPEIERLALFSPRPGYKAIQIQERGFARRFASRLVSDGVLLYLGFLAIAFQKHGPQIICLKEPERGLHPLRLADVLGLMDRLVETRPGTQVLISSHSPQLLELFGERPHRVRFVERTNGRTEILGLGTRLGHRPGGYQRAMDELWTTGEIVLTDDE